MCFNSTMVRLKVGDRYTKGDERVSFQFHNGSIKSLTGFTTIMIQTSFNSTMVRLKAVLEEPTRDPNKCFNSTMVRLKAGTAVVLVATSLLGFNSTMVRLKAPLPPHPKSLSPSFNSTMVRLKVDLTTFINAGQPSFNSTMVRLKVPDVEACRDDQLGFNSTMVRLKAWWVLLTMRCLRVSIPQWFD